MSGITVLAIGGPKHGEQLPWQDGRGELLVPLMPPLSSADTLYLDGWCVHGGSVISQYDGDMHRVPADRVAALYGLRPSEWRRSPTNGRSPREAYERARQHPLTKRCLFPDPSGRYELPLVMPAFTEPYIKSARYRIQVIAAVVVYVYVGS